MPSWPCPKCTALLEAVDAARFCPHCQGPLVVAGEFRLDGLLGRGGVGTVYSAVRESDGLRCAVKIVTLPESGGWQAHDLFVSSHQALQSLSHPALPRVYAFEQDLDGRLVLAREAFDGGTLAERVDEQHRHLAPEQFRQVMASLLELLAYLHSRVPPVLHRDIKPANVMFRSKGDWDPVLVDFDTVTPPGGHRTGLTIVGTPGYAAPEQFYGEATPASDLYALGVTLLNLATHSDPSELPRASGRFQVDRHLTGLPDEVRRVLLKLVEPEVRDRYQDAADAIADLEGGDAGAAELDSESLVPLLDDDEEVTPIRDPAEPIPPPPPPPELRPLPRRPPMASAEVSAARSRRMVSVSMGLGLATLVGVGGAVFYLMARPAPSLRPRVSPAAPARTSTAPPRRPAPRPDTPPATATTHASPPPTTARGPYLYPGNDRALLRLDSVPPGAKVLVNGRARCKTPCSLRLRLGRYRIRFRHPKGGDEVRMVDFIADQDLAISF